MMRLLTIANLLGIACQQDAPINCFAIDSRQVKPGTLFIAIKGEHLDGHDFAHDAQKNGAAAVLSSHPIADLSIPELIVNDVTLALGVIAKHHRQKYSIPIIALTGSNGKTSVKEMINAILPKPSLATEGNLNNHLGAPLSMLRLNDTHLAAVFELGANHVGEISYTSNLLHPDVALVNNIAPAHIGEFGSIENIAQTKGEIFNSLSAEGIAVINEDDPYAHFWDKTIGERPILRFSRNQKTDIYAENITHTDKGLAAFTLHLPHSSAKVSLRVPGLHNVSNALAAAACCYAIGLSPEQIYQGLESFQGVQGRLTFLRGLQGSTIIDDTYNANLRSVLAAIEVLAKQPGKKILILGDMKELGTHTGPHHEAVGEAAKNQNIEMLYTCGEHTKTSSKTFGKGAVHCDSQVELIERIKPLLNEDTTVLVKGSRSATMEYVVAALTIE
jgi:UDP-N-acetylmuramoyl-tripeptide--D-alanyl-D-alanine ligase